MIRVPLNKVKDDLSRYLRMAEKEEIIVTRHGVPAGMLIGFADPEDWWEELLLRDPRFKARVAQARKSAREGKVHTIEEVRAEFGIPEPKKARKPHRQTKARRTAKTRRAANPAIAT